MIQASTRSGGLLHPAVMITAVALALATIGLGSVTAQGTIVILGSVVNGTAGAKLPPQLPVFLLVSDTAGALVSTQQTTTDLDGAFQFDDVPETDGGVYALSVDHAGVFYDTSFTFQEVLDKVQITVYEPTQDTSMVRVTLQILVIGGVDKKDREISAIEFVRLTNSGDRTLLPDLSSSGQPSFLRFALPPQANQLNVRANLPEGDVVSIGTGFALTSAVVPGDHSLEFSFRFPYTGDSVAYRQSLPQGADVYQVLVPQRLTEVEVAPLQPISSVEIAGAAFRAWEGRGFEPGQGTVLELSNLPQPGLATRLQKSITDGTFWQVAIPSAFGVILALFLLFGVFKAPRRATSPVGAADDQRNMDLAQRDALVQEVASLDEQFQRGDVAEAEYHHQREELIARILRHHGVDDEKPPQDSGEGDG